jgi:hypothetical protein
MPRRPPTAAWPCQMRNNGRPERIAPRFAAWPLGEKKGKAAFPAPVAPNRDQ